MLEVKNKIGGYSKSLTRQGFQSFLKGTKQNLKGGENGILIENMLIFPVGYPQFSVDGKRRKNYFYYYFYSFLF